jgi:hypothetical protein
MTLESEPHQPSQNQSVKGLSAPALKLVDSGPQWTTPTIDEGRPITGHFHGLEVRGYLPYVLPGGNPKTGKLSPRTSITLATFGKVPCELNYQGLYIGMLKWTKRGPTTFEEAKGWQKRGENALLRTGRIATFSEDAPALIAIDCDAETEEMSAAFLEIVEKKFGRLALRRRSDKPHRWLTLVKAAGEAGDLAAIRVVYTDRDGEEARIEMLSRSCQVAVAGVSASGGEWTWPDGMPALSELKEATCNDLTELERAFKAAVRAHGGRLGKKTSQTTKLRDPRISRPREELSAEQWINQQALDNILKWAPVFFPGGGAASDGAWRVSPEGTFRTCEEDLAIHPNGIFDFGGERGYTAIGLIQAFFDEDASGDLVETEKFDDDRNGFNPLGSVSRERAIAELCQLLKVDWQAEVARDRTIAEQQLEDDFGSPAGAPEPGPTRGLPLVMFDELKPSEETLDFVENTLRDGELSVVYGESNVGKTFSVVDLGLHVALGWPWHGREVDRGGVIYIAGEGAGGIKQRVAAFRQHHGFEKTADAWFAVVPAAVNFRDKASVAGLVSLIKEAANKLGGRVRLVIVDTLSRALAGGDENSSVDMGAVVNAADRVKNETGAHVMLVHHSGKDQTKGARGHSLLRGNVDTEILVKRGDGQWEISFQTEKQRELPAEGMLYLRLAKIQLGTNRRGKPITSRVVEKAEMPSPKLNEKSSMCLQTLNEMLPEDVSECGPGEVMGVEFDAWRNGCLQRLEEGGVANSSTRRSDFKRAKEELLKHRYITISGSRVEIPW